MIIPSLKLLKHLFLVILFFLIFSCAPIKPNGATSVDLENQNTLKDKIISINVDVYQPSVGDKDSLALYEVQIVDGFLKRDILPTPGRTPGKWMFSFLNSQQELIKNTTIEDPLIVDHEYLGGTDGDVKLKHIEMKLEKATISVRARYSPDMRFVLMEKVDSLGNPVISEFYKINE